MNLSLSQLQALRDDIAASEFGALPQSPDNAFAVAAAYNLGAVPDYIVWRTSVPVAEIMLNGFDWTRVDNLGVGKARAWEWMTQFGFIDPSQANVRAGIEAVWVGTAADLAVRAAVYVHCKRNAKRFEKLFAVGDGTTESPSALIVDGTSQNLEYRDIINAWES